MQMKLLVLFAFILLILVGLNLRIAYITARSGDKYKKQVLSQQWYDSRSIPFRRGEIQDTNGNVLARCEKVYHVILDCEAVNTEQEEKKVYVEPTVKALTDVLGLDEADIRRRITDEATMHSQYQILSDPENPNSAVQITEDQKKEFEKREEESIKEYENSKDKSGKGYVLGVWFEAYYIRKYPMNSMASNVLGFSNTQNTGVCGLEAYYNEVLNGVNGREYGYLNEDSELKRTVIEPEHGKTIITTLDVNIQEVVEKYIREFDEENPSDPDGELMGKGSKNTAVIVGDPNSGEIYAMATNHGFDLNDPMDYSGWYTKEEMEGKSDEEKSEALNTMWKNFCVSEAFEPGSTFKPITMSTALETGALKGDETFICDGGEFVTDTQINCDNIYGHGQETVIDAIKNSCNDALMQVGRKIGVEDFCKYQRLFNFGRPTGIDLPMESSGILYDPDSMHEVELATNSFGQGFTCTMVQEFAAFSAVVNGGYYYQPHLVRQILDVDGGVAKTIDPLLELQPISARSSSILREALEAGVREGTGKKAKVPGYRVGGKTGTAEKINPATGQRWAGRYLVSFIGCVPADDPQVVIYVIVDEPNVEDQSVGGYAHIIARKILQEILPYLNIFPTEEITDEELQKIGITRDEAEIGRKLDNAAEPETDEYGNVIETEPETDENGNPIQPESDEQGVADNPNMAAPPQDNGHNSSNTGEDAGVTPEEIGID